MKNIEDFKGTQTDFLLEGSLVYSLQPVVGRYIKGEPVMENRVTAYVQGNGVPIEELQANAKLFASSKQLLQVVIMQQKLILALLSGEPVRNADEIVGYAERVVNDAL